MSIFFNVKIGMQDASGQVFDIGKGIQTDLHFVAHAIYINMYQGWSFVNESSFHISDHETKVREKRVNKGKERGK